MPFDDDELLEEIAHRFNVSKEEVVKSRKMSAEYDKEHQRRKAKRKDEAKKEAIRKDKEKYRREHPDECFCVEDGFDKEANHLYDGGDEIVGHEVLLSVLTGKFESPLFKCRRCGKKYGYPATLQG